MHVDTITDTVKRLAVGESYSRSHRFEMGAVKGDRIQALKVAVRNSLTTFITKARREMPGRGYTLEIGTWITTSSSHIVVNGIITRTE